MALLNAAAAEKTQDRQLAILFPLCLQYRRRLWGWLALETIVLPNSPPYPRSTHISIRRTSWPRLHFLDAVDLTRTEFSNSVITTNIYAQCVFAAIDKTPSILRSWYAYGSRRTHP